MNTSMSINNGTESGYNYFGARYYTDNIMMWLSVDPMSDMRPGVSPYSYCQNNPIGRIDPSGALDGWIEDANGNVFWDPNTNSQSEFNVNYANQKGYSYVSDVNNPNNYTLPNGDGTLSMIEWKTYAFEDGVGGPSIKMEFFPSDESAKTGWFQTYKSNIPDCNESILYTAVPYAFMSERLDGNSIVGESDIKRAAYFDNPPSNLLTDIPTRSFNNGAKTSVNWNAQSSMIINGERSFTIGWGFSISSKNSGTYFAPTILKSPTTFHENAIKYLK